MSHTCSVDHVAKDVEAAALGGVGLVAAVPAVERLVVALPRHHLRRAEW